MMAPAPSHFLRYVCQAGVRPIRPAFGSSLLAHVREEDDIADGR
jgi:hypothetical protein